MSGNRGCLHEGRLLGTGGLELLLLTILVLEDVFYLVVISGRTVVLVNDHEGLVPGLADILRQHPIAPLEILPYRVVRGVDVVLRLRDDLTSALPEEGRVGDGTTSVIEDDNGHVGVGGRDRVGVGGSHLNEGGDNLAVLLLRMLHLLHTLRLLLLLSLCSGGASG